MNSSENIKEVTKEKGTYLNHLRVGVNAIIPFILVAGLITIFTYFFNIDTNKTEGFIGSLVKLSTMILAFVVPVLSAFIAMSIASKDGFLPGLIGGALASVIGAGFIGGIIAGFLAGYITMYLNNKLKFSEKFTGFKGFFLIPFLATLIVGLLMIYIGEPICKFLFNIVNGWVSDLMVYNIYLTGFVIGLFVAFDVGGSVSKAVILSSLTFMSTGLIAPQAAAFGAAMVAPLGLSLAVFINKNKYRSEEIETSKFTWLFGLSGITEGALPFIIGDPLRVIPSIMIGSSITGLLVTVFECGVKVANGGLFAFTVANSITGIAAFLFSVVVGSFVTAYILNTLKK